MPGALNTLQEEVKAAFQQITTLNGYSQDWDNNIQFEMETPDPQSLASASFPRLIIIFNDIEIPELGTECQQVEVTIDVIGYLRVDNAYDGSQSEREVAYSMAKDLQAGIHEYFERQKTGAATLDSFQVGSITQRIGKAERLLTCATEFRVQFEETTT